MKNLAIAAGLLAALVATRWALAPPYLFYFDNVNFALAVREFNIALHQPHPPGYPLYVALLKALDLVIPSAKYAQLVAGSVGSLAALWLIRKLGTLMFGARAGWLAVAILILQPSFWLAGIGDQVRTFLAAGGVAVALCVRRAWQADEPARLYLAAAVLGVAGGFRPDLVVLPFPLLATALLRTRVRLRAVLALATLASICAVWFAAIVWKSGGPSGFAELFHHQWQTSSAHTTVLGGASAAEELRTAIRAIYWSGVGALAWIWAVPLVWKRLRWREVRPQLALLAWWWIPALLFHAVAFVHDPDTTLDASPALALLGAWVLAQLPRPWLAGVAAMGIQATIFAASPLGNGRDASYARVKRVGTETADAIDRLRALPVDGTVVVTNRSLVTPRQIGYYFPQLRIVDVDADLRSGCPAGPRLDLPPAARLMWLAPADGSLDGPACKERGSRRGVSGRGMPGGGGRGERSATAGAMMHPWIYRRFRCSLL